MTRSQVLFGLDGRLPRLPFWFAMLALLVVELAILTPFGLFNWNARDNPAPLAFRLLQFGVTLVIAYPAYASMLKRLHDRDYPGTPALLAVLLDLVGEFSNVLSPIETEDGFYAAGLGVDDAAARSGDCAGCRTWIPARHAGAEPLRT